jgi:hypothetical protein
MKTKLIDLWRFPPFRSALKKEALRFFLGLVLGLCIAAFSRWYFDWEYTRDRLVAVAVGIITITFIWFLSVVRTVREVLREHSLLER